MKDSEILLNPNKLVRYLKKPASEFTKDDIIKFIIENKIEMLNFRYVAEDGKLKTLNFIITGKEYLDRILTSGERVDGSSLFSFVSSASADLYVVPRYKTAFVNPFTEVPTLDILCSFYTSEGKPLENSPEYILKKAHNEFKRATGSTFMAMGELEYYVISSKGHLYPVDDQKGYHSAPPFANWEHLRLEAMRLISQSGGKIKYGHSEVGNFSTETEEFEQHEIEFIPVEVEDAADQIIIAKWMLRMLGNKYGVNISFAPKITEGKAGSGLHIHVKLNKGGQNQMVKNNKLSDTAKKVIAGFLDLAAPLTAFGNTIPTSYFRLVPHQEAPVHICWGDKNRSVLVRVPLGWLDAKNMIKDANPQEKSDVHDFSDKQTIEIRTPDGAADIYLLIAGLVVAAQHGLEMKDALKKTEKLYVDVDIFKKEHKKISEKLESLPASCWESAECLEKNRRFFEKNNIFPSETIDVFIKNLKFFRDKNLSERLYGKNDEIRELVDKFLHWM